ncbi:unnamed protein product [Penicillium bialowiezense]
MDWGLRLQRAFALEAIVAGSLETEPTFSPPLKVNSISGVDESFLVGNRLRLGVSVYLQYVSIDQEAHGLMAQSILAYLETSLQGDVGSKSAKKIKLQWVGTVLIGECEQSIIRGDFEGETDFGNPLVKFQFDVDKDEDLVELEDRIFVGQGRFVKNAETEKLSLVYQLQQM